MVCVRKEKKKYNVSVILMDFVAAKLLAFSFMTTAIHYMAMVIVWPVNQTCLTTNTIPVDKRYMVLTENQIKPKPQSTY